MNQRVNIAAGIEKNRIALLRMVFCWLSAAMCLNVRGDKPLPRRLSTWVEELTSKAEKATGYLLIAIFYRSQIKRCACPEFAKAAHNFAYSNRIITLRTLTISGVVTRLKALQHRLHNLHAIARRLAKNIAARLRISAKNFAAMDTDRHDMIVMVFSIIAPEDAVPP